LVSEFIFVKVHPVFSAGTENYIRWRGTDFAGNKITYSEAQKINIDQERVRFKDPTPASDEIVIDTEVLCLINIEDLGGSDVDPSTVQYKYSDNGLDSFSEWTNEYLNIKDRNTYFVYLTFSKGRENYIIWRARDMAGNNYTESEIFNISAGIVSPKTSDQYTNIDKILFDGTSSIDPDSNDDLRYIWESDISKVFSEKPRFYQNLPPGVHNITLTVIDLAGHVSIENLELTISQYIPPEQNQTDIDTTEDDSKDGAGEINPDIIIFAGIIVVVIIILIVFNLIKRRIKAKEKEDAESDVIISQMPAKSKFRSLIKSSKIKEGKISKESDTGSDSAAGTDISIPPQASMQMPIPPGQGPFPMPMPGPQGPGPFGFAPGPGIQPVMPPQQFIQFPGPTIVPPPFPPQGTVGQPFQDQKIKNSKSDKN
jgi:hypothetical protein